MMLPSLALAKMHIRNGSEGDPGDGQGSTGSGGLPYDLYDKELSEVPSVRSLEISATTQLWPIPINQNFQQLVIFPIWENGLLQFVIIYFDYNKFEAIR